MKKLLIVAMCVLVGLFMVGCGGGGDSGEKPATEAVNEKQDEMTEKAVMYYLTAMTSKYISIDNYESKSPQQQKMLDEALTDVNIAVLEIEDKYTADIPAVKDLNQLAESIIYAIKELQSGNYVTKHENAKEVGGYIGEVSRNYLDGELPAVVKAQTGLESAYAE
jgi:PBP1b-binding outer membrane lipoprotein LpoB